MKLLNMTPKEIIKTTIAFVKMELEGAEAGHDWHHINRVHTNALKIAKSEEVDQLTVELAALLHDIADAKFHGGDESIGPKKAREFLESLHVEKEIIGDVVNIIENISFKNSIDGNTFYTNEFAVVQDADRLDAIGAIGIARCFHFGGFKNNLIYNADIPPKLNMSKEEYKKSNGTSINHFYEKLLLLKDKMNTKTGRKMAEERHQFMVNFLNQFMSEVE